MRGALWFLLLFSLLASVILAQDCQESDYEGQYTQCRPDNTRDLVYYLKRTSTCTGGIPAPRPMFDLPCNITCTDGEYLPLGSLTCSPCAPGTFTRGGGIEVNQWETWPTSIGVFYTYCASNVDPKSYTRANCSGWVLGGQYARSGAITDTQSSILILQTQLILAGVIRFSYRVSAEPYWDGLIFYIDGVVVLPRTSVTTTFVEYATNVSAGYHTFAWEYYKDRDTSRGEDAAFIRSIEIVGLTYAEPSCLPCEPATFAANPASIQCGPCPLNSYADNPGTTTCTACPDGQFAYMGSSACQPKVPCTPNDYQILYGPCSGNARPGVAVWLEPHLCDDSALPLPASTSVPCPACPPGTSPDTSFNCVACPTGHYSVGGGAECLPCGAGHAASKVFNFSVFDSWPPGVTTQCSGYCGTDGWRLRSTFIDSGAGHGETVDSSFNIPIVLEQPGFVTFTFEFVCARFCALFYLDSPYDAAIQWNTSSVPTLKVTYTTPSALEVGPHNLTWTFESEPSAANNTYTDAIRIYSIIVNGTSSGGASSCTPCFVGSVAGDQSSFCTNCSAGLSNDPTFSQCEACQGNSFSPHSGGACYECGPTTLANTNHTDCNDNCTFVLNGSTYDLTPLSFQSFGPVAQAFGNSWDDTNYYYFINLCGRGGFVSDCHDIDDVPLNTHVCQVLPYGYALDVGWSTGYYPIPIEVGEKGFRVHYDLGTLGCGPKNHGVPYPRSSDLTFICDPTAGLGTMQGLNGVEDTPCHYSFVWRSLYACPICTTNDYTFYYTLCDANGNRNKIYYWKDPVLCHDGVKLPANELQLSCSDSMVECGIGQLISDDGQTCIPCPEDQYSVGGGLLISNWPIGTTNLPYGYTTSCASSCTLWESDDGISIHSGSGDNSLYGSHIFRTAGSITFNYKVYASHDGGFGFYVDGLPKLVRQKGSSFDWISFTYNVSAGTHIFQWRFVNGIRYSVPLQSYQGVSIYNILVQGLDYHAESCLPCPQGTYSSPDPGVIGCLACPANSYNNDLTSICTPCPAHMFSLPGSTSCQNKTACTLASYVPQYTACSNGTRDVVYVPLEPQVCENGAYPPDAQYGIACAGCAPYTIAQGGECVPCPLGQYFSNGTCVPNAAGHIVQYSSYYFYDDSTTDEWPAGFFTGCSGVCGTPGWRLAGASIDSGFHSSNTIDSYVGITTNFVYNGQVAFTYVANTGAFLDGLQFAIDGVVVPIAIPGNETEPVTVTAQIPTGAHTLLWNYHQEASAGFVTINNIVLQGVEGGKSASAQIACDPGTFATDPAATNCSVCNPGTFAPAAGSSTCTICPVNSYNPNFGASECLQCETGSFANSTGSTQCDTSCNFSIGKAEYDLTWLPPVATAYDTLGQKYSISVCKNVGGQCPNSHVCIASDNSVIQVGNSFRFVPDPDNSTGTPFSIAFEHGDLCPGTNAYRSAIIEFECEIDSPSNVPEFERQDDNCVVIFSWRTTMGCRKCVDSDYTTITGACSGGKRRVWKTRTTACNGVASISLNNESCSGTEFPTAAIVVIVLVFVAIVALAGFIFFRNRRLAAQYASLVEETRSASISM